jgi:hypothetical protein
MRRKSIIGILALAVVAIIVSHLPYALKLQTIGTFTLLPLPVLAICLVLVPQRHSIWLIVASIATFAVAAFTLKSDGNWRAASLDILTNTLAVAALGWAYGFRQSRDQKQAKSWIRLTTRLKRQSEQLRTNDSQLMAAIKTQNDAQQAYLQSEAERQTLLEHLPVYVLQKIWRVDSRLQPSRFASCSDAISWTYSEKRIRTCFHPKQPRNFVATIWQ